MSQVEEAALERTVFPLGREDERIGVEQVSWHQGKVDNERSAVVPLCSILECKAEKSTKKKWKMLCFQQKVHSDFYCIKYTLVWSKKPESCWNLIGK